MVYVLLARGFEEIEALCPVDMMRRAGIECKTVSIAEEYVTGAHGITVKADALLTDITDTPELLMLPGGQPGTNNLDFCAEVHRLIRETDAAGGYLAAICAAPMILGYSGYFMGKEVTCYPGFEKFLMGATKPADRKVIRDGNIITACGMGVAVEFGAELIRTLKDEQTAAKVLKSIQY